MKNQKQMSESYLVGALLAITGGFLDAYTYLLRGHVFANAQTGNMVLFAIKLADGSVKAAAVYLIPITAFIVGIILAEIIRKKMSENLKLHWRQLILMIEFVIIFIAAFIPLGRMNGLVNVLVSFVCAMQVEAFRKLEGNAYATTMCTGNLRSASESLFHFVSNKEKPALRKSLLYYGITLFFIFGAFLGAVISHLYGSISILFCCGLLMIVFILMWRKD